MIRTTIANITKFVFNAFLCGYAAYAQSEKFIKVDDEQKNRMTTNKSVGCSHEPQETATDSGYVGLQANFSTVGLFANKYIALNHEWNITGNSAVKCTKH